ncbi:MAG: VTT domain-containing protein [Chloroflexi bacterium]|nr:VTT domain-containing protein [Chloroflexota bacterium]
MSDFLLTQIINYGAPVLGMLVFIGALGAPLPGTLLIVAAGAFARQGLLAWHTTGLMALAFVVLGDNLSYGMGHFAREPVLRRFQSSQNWTKAESTFARWGGMAVFWTRFLITGVAVPVNLIAGTSGFGIRRFFFYDLAGEAIWIFGYGGLGYLFGMQWEVVSEFLGNVSGLALGLVLLGLGVWLGIRQWQVVEARKANVPEG